MKQQTCIFFGRSGSGKGTQAAKLIEYLKKTDNTRNTLYIETGQRFREYTAEQNTYSKKLIADVMNRGGLFPPFIPIWLWTSMMLEQLTGNEHIVCDGLARRHEEAPILDQALQFFSREKPIVFLLDVSDEEAKRRLLARGRHDDTDEKIAERLKWFQTDAMQAIHYFERSPHVQFVHINGERDIDVVSNDIIAHLS